MNMDHWAKPGLDRLQALLFYPTLDDSVSQALGLRGDVGQRHVTGHRHFLHVQGENRPPRLLVDRGQERVLDGARLLRSLGDFRRQNRKSREPDPQSGRAAPRPVQPEKLLAILQAVFPERFRCRRMAEHGRAALQELAVNVPTVPFQDSDKIPPLRICAFVFEMGNHRRPLKGFAYGPPGSFLTGQGWFGGIGVSEAGVSPNRALRRTIPNTYDRTHLNLVKMLLQLGGPELS